MRILCFEIKYVGFGGKDNRKWKALAKEGRTIDAIKGHRMVHGSSLKEARDAVFKYLGRSV